MVEKSGCIRGFEAQKWVEGRKRHLLADTSGLPCSICATTADMLDAQGAACLPDELLFFVPELKKTRADAAYRGQDLADWRKWGATGKWKWSRVLLSVPQSAQEQRLRKDDERKVQTSDTWLEVAMMRLLVARLRGPPAAATSS